MGVHNEGVPVQVNPGLTTQIAEQPSLAIRLPSSHLPAVSSIPLNKPSPQTGVHLVFDPGILLQVHPKLIVWQSSEQPSSEVDLPLSQI